MLQNIRHRLDLQIRDLNFLEALFDMRYLTAKQLATLFPSTYSNKNINPNSRFKGGQEAIRKRLLKLSKFGLIKSLGLNLRRPNEPAIYYPTKMSAKVLSEKKGRPYDELMKQVNYTRKYLGDKRTQYKNIFLDHRLGINDFRICLTASLDRHPKADLVIDEQQKPFWKEPTLQNKLKITATVSNADIPKIAQRNLTMDFKTTKISKAPDAIFLLKINGQHIGYIYEKDKGTEQHSTIATKLICYWHWFKNQKRKPPKQTLFGTHHIRILIETETSTRLDNMIKKAVLPVRPSGAGIFWLTNQANIDLDNPDKILAPIWTVAHINRLHENHSLLEI